MPPPPDSQLSLEGLEPTLDATTFVVVDLETTGTNPDRDSITEIGAIKVRGGEVIGELATLIRPAAPIPPFITRLTGITDEMVADAPHIEVVLPSLLEFMRDCVVVAHNAPFDLGFLRAATARHDLAWPAPEVLCTVRLARRVLDRDEAPSVKLAALAALFEVRTSPTHRALDDARATVEVLHALIGRVGGAGVTTLDALRRYRHGSAREAARHRALADGLPHAPGVYMFVGHRDEVLYVGTAADLRRRVLSYFTGSDPRAKVRDLVRAAIRVDHLLCAHALEAEVRELRVIDAHRPPYNRRARDQHSEWWLRPAARPSATRALVTSREPTGESLGPFRSRAEALRACDLVTSTVAPRAGEPPGPLGAHSADVHATLAALLDGDDTAVTALRAEVGRLASAHRYEEAAALRDETARLIHSVHRIQRLAALASIAELVVALPDGSGGWGLAIIRHGRLAAAGKAARGVPPFDVIDALTPSAMTILPGPGMLCGASAHEVSAIARHLDPEGVRIVSATSPWKHPHPGMGPHLDWAESAVLAATRGPDRTDSIN